jgi:hypothetical protein
VQIFCPQFETFTFTSVNSRYPLLTNTSFIIIDVFSLFFSYMSLVHYLPYCPRTEKQAEEEEEDYARG